MIWQDYTPSNTNVTVGNGTQVARYAQIGKTVFVEYALTFGSTTAFSGTVDIGLPVSAADPGQDMSLGAVHMLDAGTTNRTGVIVLDSPTVTSVRFIPDSSGSFVNATNPHTWTTSDRLSFLAVYEAA